jgi:hypothetical protein
VEIILTMQMKRKRKKYNLEKMKKMILAERMRMVKQLKESMESNKF